MNSTATQLSNRTLGAGLTADQTAGVQNGTGYTSPTNTGTSGVNTSTRSLGNTGADSLSNYLSANSLDQQNKSIMDNYNTANTQSQSATTQGAQAITDTFQPKLELQQQQNDASVQGAEEAQRGFAQNTAALMQLQNSNAARIRDLNTQQQQALLANNAAGAQRLSDLAVKEQETLTTARQNWVSNLLGLSTAQNQASTTQIAQQQESRNEASFQTPEQKSVMDLSTSHPDAGVLPTDTLAQATAKVQGSKSYQQNVQLGQANIASAQASAQASQASAGLSGAQTQQQRTLTGLISPNSTSTSSDVQDLVNHKLSPQALQEKYANATNGGDIVKSIISQAQAQGYDLNSGVLGGQRELNINNSASSGNPLTSFTAGVQSLFTDNSKKTTGNADYQSYLKSIGLSQ